MQTVSESPKGQKINTQKLYFIQDLHSFDSRTVYSGHSGKGKKFKIIQGDYGKYAMKPTSKSNCQELIKSIEKDSKGLTKFQWNIVPMTEIKLCNFYEDTEWNFDAYYKLQDEQKNI